MTSNEFNLIMDTECSRCKKAVKFHRITPSGTSYCLEFNHRNGWSPIYAVQTEQRQRAVYRVKVNELIRSPLPTSIGKLINSELHGYLKESE